MAKYKIYQVHAECIGCGSCTLLCPDYWEMGGDGKSQLKGFKDMGGKHTIDIDEVACNQEAADACPAKCIHVENI